MKLDYLPAGLIAIGFFLFGVIIYTLDVDGIRLWMNKQLSATTVGDAFVFLVIYLVLRK